MVRLRTGEEVAEAVMHTTMMSVDALWKTNFGALLELLVLARHPGHQLFGETLDKLRRIGLLDEQGTLHDETRKVVLAAFLTDNDHWMQRVDPLG